MFWTKATTLRHLQSWSFCLDYVLRQACLYLITTSELENKLLLGRIVGYIGRSLETIDRRLRELGATGNLIAPNASTPVRLDEHFHNEQTHLNKVVSALRAITRTINSSLDALDYDLDEPSRLCVVEVLSILGRIESYMSSVKLAADFAMENVDITFDEVIIPARVGIPDSPARPGAMHYDSKPAIRHTSDAELVRDPELLERFAFFAWIDIEIGAAEVCCKSILDAPLMPLEFRLDLARQIWDEVRHAAILDRWLSAQSVARNKYPYCLCVWEKYHRGRSLAERLAIQHVVQEGNGYEDTFQFLRELRAVRETPLAEIFEFIMADEALHVGIGNKWVLRLVNGVEAEYARCVDDSVTLLGTTIPRTTLNTAARLATGFPGSFVRTLSKNAKLLS